MLEEESDFRGELCRGSQPPVRLPQGTKCWPPPSPTSSPPSRPRGLPPRHEKRAVAIEWPPRNSCLVQFAAPTTSDPCSRACNAPNLQTNDEQTNTSGRPRYSFPKGGIKRVVAWPPAPDNSINSFAAQDFQNRQGDLSTMNGVPLQANPPASLYYAPPPANLEAECGVMSSSEPSDGFQSVSSPPVTLFTLPSLSAPLQPPSSTVTLRKEPPMSQPPMPVIKSQPAINDKKVFRSSNLRGDMKWPPASVKAMQEADEIKNVTRGPAVKPKLCRKDYSSFFAQHALTATYPGYRAPPGTQHYPDNGTEQ